MLQVVQLDRLFKGVAGEYTAHAFDNVPSIFFTVMLWAGAQNLINEVTKTYLPELATWQIASVEIFVASYCLWAVTREKKKNGKDASAETQQPQPPTG